MSDLLDMLADLDEPTEIVVHALMPWMGSACGTACPCGGGGRGGCPPQSSRHKFSLGPYATTVTCPACLACGDLSAIAQASQRPERMARVES